AGNVYGGGGLEWLPAGLYSTRSIPVVTSLYPLWDQKNLARDVAAGRYFLPGAPTGGRETLVTSPVNAEPQHLLRMPIPSGWHVWAAVFTAGFFLLLTVQAYAASVLSGVLAIVCVLRWCWFLDHPLPQQTVDVGAGIELPTYASGSSSTGWWAMVVTLVVGGMVLAMSVFSYVFLWSRSPDTWRPPPDTTSLAVATASAIGGGALALLARRQLGRPWLATAMVIAGGALLGLAFGVDLSSWRSIGLSPQASAQGAIVHAILAWQGFFVAVAAIMALYVLLRRLYGYVGPDRPATIELVGLFLAYTAGQGLVGLYVTRLFPAGLA
ncbi:cytochrome ubiquinol oxidase subunit I, partial [Caulobacter radicis]